MKRRIRLPAVAAAGAALVGFAATAVAEQVMPASEHQADVIAGAERKGVRTPATEKRMPVTDHQTRVLREFEAADVNRDGTLTRAEYTDYMVRQDAARYNASLTRPEQHGVEAAGPRDRHAADGSEHPVASKSDPTPAQ